MCVCWREMISSSIGPYDQLLDLLSYQNFDLSVGYPQIKSEPTMFVMLSYSWFFLEHTPLYLLFWPMLSPCSHNGGIPVIWKISMSCCWAHQQHFVSSMIHVEHQPSVGNFVSNAFVFRSWSLCLDGRSDFLEFMCIWCKLQPWVRENCFFLWYHPRSVMHVRLYSMVW